jgi:hypothetical protein
MTCCDNNCRQGRDCPRSLRATRAVYIAIALRIVRWFRETPEQPFLLAVVGIWTWFTASCW